MGKYDNNGFTPKWITDIIDEKVKMDKPKASLRQWQIQKRSGKHCLVGEIVSHPRLIEGETTISKPLLFVCFKTMIAETEDMVFELL